MDKDVTRRRALTCMAWGGTGLLWSVAGGIPRARMIDQANAAEPGSFTFAQISDSHIGFHGDANPDVAETLQEGLRLVAATKPALLLHTGDVSHLSRPEQFDIARQAIGGLRLDTHYVPGEHDVLDADGRDFFAGFMPQARPGGWYSFDQQGVHFIGLNNVSNLRAGGLGLLGTDQLAWLAADLRDRAASQPIVVFAHIPLWTVYPQWGWGTDDSAQALSYLARFGSVTVLNGHIHQVLQKIEGNVAFHTALSTAFPQPAPGSAPSPGPMKVPADRLRGLLGVRSVDFVAGTQRLATIDTPLGA
jgi:hypothetical protein